MSKPGHLNLASFPWVFEGWRDAICFSDIWNRQIESDGADSRVRDIA